MNIELFLGAIKQQIQPEGRAQHLVGMLQPLLVSLPQEVRLADLGFGWQLLARPYGQPEPAAVAHRREVCARLSEVVARLTNEPGDLTEAVKAWQTWQQTCQKSGDPRLSAMAKTLTRELGELQSAQK